MNTVRSLGLMHDLQEYIVTVEAIAAKRKAEIDKLKEEKRDMERLLKMNKQAARKKDASLNEAPTLAGPKTGFGDIANQDIPPKVRGIIEDNRMLKEEVRQYRDKSRASERTAAAQQVQINKMKDEMESLRGQLKECKRSPGQMASEADLQAQLSSREASVKDLESRIEVLNHKLKVDARQRKDEVRAKEREVVEAKRKTEEVGEQLAEKDLELRQKVLDCRQVTKKLEKCRTLLVESRREAVHLQDTLERFHEERYGEGMLHHLRSGEASDMRVMLCCVYVDGGEPSGERELVEEEASAAAVEQVEFSADEAATKVQSAYRGHLVRREMKEARTAEEEAAAIKIQAQARGHLARKELEAYKSGQNEEDSHAQEAAAVKIQAQARGHLARKQVNQRRAEGAAKGKETTTAVSAKGTTTGAKTGGKESGAAAGGRGSKGGSTAARAPRPANASQNSKLKK